MGALRKLVSIDGGDRKSPTIGPEHDKAIDAASKRVVKATTEHETHAAALRAATDELATAQAEFDAGNDRSADSILKLRARRDRAELFEQRAKRALNAAEAKLASAKQTKVDAEIAVLEQRADHDALMRRVEELWASEGEAALGALMRFFDRIETETDAAKRAAQEIGRRRQTPIEKTPAPDGRPFARSILRKWLIDTDNRHRFDRYAL